MTYRISIVALITAAALGGCATKPSPAVSPEAAATRVSERAPRIVAGDLDIANQSSLEAFEELDVVTGTLTIVGNTRLKNLNGLRRLRAVGKLVITENLALENIEGLSNLRHAREVTISANPRLENLDGLASLRKVDRLVVSDNGIFCTSGLDGLTEVGDLVVAKNPRLLSLRGFSRLESAQNVTVVQNPRLSTRGGFLSELSRVQGKLEVDRNAGLAPSDVRALHDRLGRRARVVSRAGG